MWAQARYDLRLSDAEFWALTPRKFDLLLERRRLDLVHTEMLHAFTTATLRNRNFFTSPAEPVTPLHFMPHHERFGHGPASPAAVEQTAEQRVAQAQYEAKVLELAAELRREERGPWMQRVEQGEAV